MLARRCAGRTVGVLGAAALLSSACVFWDMDDWRAAPESQSIEVDSGGAVGRDAAAEAATPSDPYRDVILADEPLGYWPLDEADGRVAHDESGNGHDGALAGPVTFGVPGAIEGSKTAVSFGSGDAKIVVSSAFSFDGNTEFSIEAWVKPTRIDQYYRRIGGRESAPSIPRQGYTLWVHDEPPSAIGFQRIADDQITGVVRPTTVGTAFVHVVGIYRSGTMELWIDGSLAASTPDARPSADPTGVFVWGNSNHAQAPFEGVLDELAVYGTALTEAQVRAHFAAAGGR